MENYCQYQQRLMTNMSSQLEPNRVWLQRFDRFFSLLGCHSLWHKTFWGIKLYLAQLRAKAQLNEAFHLAVEALEYRRFWRDHDEKWWSLMREAVTLAQDLQLEKSTDSQPLLKLIKLSQNAPGPWQGYDVAYSFASLSLWSFIHGKSQKAIEQIRTAVHADPSWAYPEYLLGWYGLWLEDIDPVSHFVRAIHADWHYFQRLKLDPYCQKFPEILRAVKQKIVIPRACP